jgi:hypothetical protein
MELVGREPEITELRATYTTAVESGASATLLISGSSGFGKTALLRSLDAFAEPRALVLRATAHPFDRVFPFAIATRISPDLHEQLDRETRERPVVITIDDAHFADDESLLGLAASVEALARRPLLVVLAYDNEHGRELPVSAQASIILRELDTQAALSLAEQQYRDAPRAVLDAIVARAHGIPYEVIVIAAAAARHGTRDEADVAFSSRAAIAKELRTLPLHERTILQMLSLLPEPIDVTLLDGPVPEFPHLGHALTAAAIAETIAMKIPLRRRIIGAIEHRGLRGTRERLMVAEQLLASGDGTRARSALLDLAFAAKAEHLSRAIVCASERHIELGEPPDDRFIEFYMNFFEALVETRNHPRAEAVAAHALSEAQHRSISPLGRLAAQLVQAQWMVDRHDAARASYARYASAFEDPRDLQTLRDAAPWRPS